MFQKVGKPYYYETVFIFISRTFFSKVLRRKAPNSYNKTMCILYSDEGYHDLNKDGSFFYIDLLFLLQRDSYLCVKTKYCTSIAFSFSILFCSVVVIIYFSAPIKVFTFSCFIH